MLYSIVVIWRMLVISFGQIFLDKLFIDHETVSIYVFYIPKTAVTIFFINVFPFPKLLNMTSTKKMLFFFRTAC